MRTFIVFSEHGRTKGDFRDLMKAGRLDILCHDVIASFFLSNAMRSDVRLHLILNGPPDPPKHIEFESNEETPFSKKDIGNMIRSVLWKYKPKKRIEAFPGVHIEKKHFEDVLKENPDFYLLEPNGKPIREVEFGDNPVFVLGDHMGLPRHERKAARKLAKERVSVGPMPYFSSQCIVVVNNHLDNIYEERSIL
jgi:tRNA (pseudouridine54-N1)-methyltransferase